MTKLGPEYRVALLALVIPLAGISGHGLCFGVAALGARQRRLQDHGVHWATLTTVDVKHFIAIFFPCIEGALGPSGSLISPFSVVATA